MKNKIFIAIILIIWFLLTVVLTFSLVGLLLFIPAPYANKSTWMDIGDTLITKLVQ